MLDLYRNARKRTWSGADTAIVDRVINLITSTSGTTLLAQHYRFMPLKTSPH